MRKCLCFILLSITALSVSGQRIYMETGLSISAFDYKNSAGESLDNLYGYNSFFLQTGYHTVTSVNRLNFSAGLSYNRYGARGSDPSVGNYFDWNAEYIGADLGLDYEVVRKRYTTNALNDFTAYLKLTLTPEFMVHGTQTINNDVYNLQGVEQFKYPFLFTRGGAGVNYTISKIFTVYAEYMGGVGFPVKLGDAGDEERLWIFSHNIGFGLFVNLPSYKSWR